jgi:hypothetical protein
MNPKAPLGFSGSYQEDQERAQTRRMATLYHLSCSRQLLPQSSAQDGLDQASHTGEVVWFQSPEADVVPPL